MLPMAPEVAHATQPTGRAQGDDGGPRARDRSGWSWVPVSASAQAHPTLRMGSRGTAVRALQIRLTALGYWLGAVDGQYGDLTRQAVVTLQKVAGLERDGVCGPATWSEVDAGRRPKARSTKGVVVEIDKPTQTLLVADDGVVAWIFNTSTGSGRKYRSGGKEHVAVTPSGDFRVFRRVDGWDDGPLGSCTGRSTSTAASPSTATPPSRRRRPRTAAAA